MIKYPQLTNHDIVELLETVRLGHYKNVPERFNALIHPMGHDLLEEVKQRLLECPLGVSQDNNLRIDLDYLFSHNHDIKTYVTEAIDTSLDRKVSFALRRSIDEVLEDIMDTIRRENLIGRSASERFALYIGRNLRSYVKEEKLFWNGYEDWLISRY